MYGLLVLLLVRPKVAHMWRFVPPLHSQALGFDTTGRNNFGLEVPKNNQLKSVFTNNDVSLLVRYVEVSLAVEEELRQAAVEVPGPGPGPHVVHRADQSLLASQPPEIIPPGEDTEVIRTRPHGLHQAHPVPHPGQPVDDAEDQALGDGHMRPRARATVPHEAARVERPVLQGGGNCQSLKPNNDRDILFLSCDYLEAHAARVREAVDDNRCGGWSLAEVACHVLHGLVHLVTVAEDEPRGKNVLYAAAS